MKKYFGYATGIVLLFILSCKKTDLLLPSQNSYQQRFFTTTTTDKNIIRIINLLQDENNKNHFLDQMPTGCGIPIWEKSIAPVNNNVADALSNQQQQKDIVIPLSINQRHVNAILLVHHTGSSFSFHCYTKEYLYNLCHAANKNIPLAEKMLLLFMIMENRVSGMQDFYHIPNDLFPHNKLHPLTDTTKMISIAPLPPKAGSQGNNIEDPNCVVVQSGVCNCVGGGCDWRSGCGYCSALYCTIPDGGGGTGGGGSWPPPDGPTSPGGTGGGNGGGNGGSGSGGNPPGCTEPFYFIEPCDDDPPPSPPPAPPLPTDTCDSYISALQYNANFVNTLKYLNSNAVLGLDYEKGYEIRDISQYNSNSYIPFAGNTNTQFIDWNLPANTFTAGLLHSHYAGLNSIFTPEDVIFMAQIFISNHAKDPNNLFFAVTSSYSVPLLMKVGNTASFRTFCEKIVGTNGNDAIKMKRFIDKFYKKINSNNPDTNEKEFLKLIKEYGAENGLLLFMGTNNCDIWTKRKIDNFGSVTSVPCSQQ